MNQDIVIHFWPDNKETDICDRKFHCYDYIT